MKIKLEFLEDKKLTLQECYNVLDNANDVLYGMINDLIIDDEDDQIKLIIHYLSLVMDKLETLK